MDQARFLRVKELFQRALSWPAAERAARLEEACGGDDGLRAEVSDLLTHAEAAGAAFLAGGANADAAALEPAVLAIPGFRVLERLAAGGSGTVYRAEQQSPRREVALKVLRIDSLSPGQVARFEREAAILASLDHPGIARVIQANVRLDGALRLPWIALEFVRGSTLDEFVRDRRPELGALLELFVEICTAVEHAHEHGIVHRDLKPSNVMIDEAGRPRVLDFGVARVREGSLAGLDEGASAPTLTGMLIGTLAYMAPEQTRGERELGPSADVYALGVMLFELLTGLPPIPLDGLDLIAGVQAVNEQEPAPLARLRPDLPADLGTILAKALEKDPARRYPSAGELAADLRRLLADRPVLARRATALYQARKFVHRNRALSLATLAVVLALATGLGAALVNLRVARRQTAFANDALDLSTAFLLELSPRLGFGEGERRHLEAVLELVERQLGSGARSRDLESARARLLYELAVLDQNAGDTRSMRARLEAAQVVRAALIAEDPRDLPSLTHLSQIFAKLGEAARGEGDVAARDRWFAQALALDEELVRRFPGDPELVEDLGWSLERTAMAASERGEHAEAERLHRRRLADALELVRLEPGNWKYLSNLTHAHHFLADLSGVRGELEAAAQHARECVRIARRLHELEPGRREFLMWLSDVCRCAQHTLQAAGAPAEARALSEEALEWAEALVFGDARAEHLRVLLLGAGGLADLQRESGELDGLADTAMRLRLTLQRVARTGEPTGLAQLEELAARLEEEARAVAR